ncbi:MAG TPA: hypothetical protein VGS22_20860 [Thermoanaerobaculia bacterium]|jgi:hypothetical protein|nr:hypothetical protein [Thermoanaerobaculia bacterium]
MAETTGRKSSGETAKKAPEAQVSVVAVSTETAGDGVVVYELRKKKGKKRKYTEGTKTLQRLGDGATRAAVRVPDAVAKGLDRFYKRSRKASKKKRDGALRELPKNLARGGRVFFETVGKAPYDVVRKVPTRRLWKQSRGLVSLAVWPLTGFGLFR